MKKSLILSAILGLATSTCAQNSTLPPVLDIETLGAATARDFSGVSLQITTAKASFESGEPIPVTFTYRNESAAPFVFTRSGTSYSPIRVVHREFRARQLDGPAFFQSKTLNSGIASEMVGAETVVPQGSVRETVFLNERFFLHDAGRYQITAWSDAVVLDNKRRWLQSAPLELQIVPATEIRKTQVLRDAKTQIDAALALARGRSLSSYPHELEIASDAARKLSWLRDERAIPLLVSALEIGNNYQFEAQNALRSYPRAAVRAAIEARMQNPLPLVAPRAAFLEWLADSPAEKAQWEAQFDARLRLDLQGETQRVRRGFLATLGLTDSPILRREPLFWHEALCNLGRDEQNLGFELFSLLSDSSDPHETPRASEFPIETADLKAALEANPPFQVRLMLFQALQKRDAAYLRQFLLARVDDFSFDYPPAAFDVFDDLQIKTVAQKLLKAIVRPEINGGEVWRDTYARRLRDLALRGATTEQLEQTEAWLLQNSPDADAPILDAIQVKAPANIWNWLQKSLKKRPLESPYDNRMRVLVLQSAPAARQIVRALLRDGSPRRRIEVLNAISLVASPVGMPESQTRWFSGELTPLRSGANSRLWEFGDAIESQIHSSDITIRDAATSARDAILALKISRDN